MFSRLIFGFLATVAVIRVLATPVVAMSDPPEIAARAAVVMDARNGRILWERNGDLALPPASTTKVMTSILALESGMLGRQMEVSSYAASQAPSKLGLKAGQEVKLRDLVYALMLKSANDAAVVVAEGISGNVRSFAARMNLKARQIGARNTFFTNPSGLPDDDHRSSAHDLALMLRYAMTVPGFRTVASTKSAFVPVEGRTVRMVPISSHNRLLDNYVVQVFGKTGYTRAAGKCFVGAAEIDGRAVMVAVLGSTNVWGDTRKLIEYGLNAVAPQSVAGLDFGTGTGGTFDRDDRDDRDEVEIPPPPAPGMRWAAASPPAPDPDRVARAWASTRTVDAEEERRRADEAAERAALAAERASAREARAERDAVAREERRIRTSLAREQRRLAEKAKREAIAEARAERLARVADARAEREAKARVERLAHSTRADAARRGRDAAPSTAASRADRDRIERLVRADQAEARGRGAKTARAGTRVASSRDVVATRADRDSRVEARRTTDGRTAGADRSKAVAAGSRTAKAVPGRAPAERGATARRQVAQGDSDDDSTSKSKRPAAGAKPPGKGDKQVASAKATTKANAKASPQAAAKAPAKAVSKGPAKAPTKTARR
ncbi:MAG: D-alanyl-D-alanine carboxypeptidase [Alphaproteobacteria bacterium]